MTSVSNAGSAAWQLVAHSLLLTSAVGMAVDGYRLRDKVSGTLLALMLLARMLLVVVLRAERAEDGLVLRTPLRAVRIPDADLLVDGGRDLLPPHYVRVRRRGGLVRFLLTDKAATRALLGLPARG